MLAPQTIFYLIFLVAIIGPPALSANLWTYGFRGNGGSKVSTIISLILLVIWCPLFVMTPYLLRASFS